MEVSSIFILLALTYLHPYKINLIKYLPCVCERFPPIFGSVELEKLAKALLIQAFLIDVILEVRQEVHVLHLQELLLLHIKQLVQ